ncbi:MAG: YlxR family protein [Anaerolineales bacterium]
MKKKATHKKRRRHVPQRTCVGCREVLAKNSLIRIVRTENGVEIDLTGKLSGRGAYLHKSRSCWNRGINGSIAHALKVELSDIDCEKLKKYSEKFIDE